MLVIIGCLTILIGTLISCIGKWSSFNGFITTETLHFPRTVLPITGTMIMKVLEDTSMIAGDLLMGVYIACYRPIFGRGVIFYSANLVPNPNVDDIDIVYLARIYHGLWYWTQSRHVHVQLLVVANSMIIRKKDKSTQQKCCILDPSCSRFNDTKICILGSPSSMMCHSHKTKTEAAVTAGVTKLSQTATGLTT